MQAAAAEDGAAAAMLRSKTTQRTITDERRAGRRGNGTGTNRTRGPNIRCGHRSTLLPLSLKLIFLPYEDAFTNINAEQWPEFASIA